jgi:hypothetical protein
MTFGQLAVGDRFIFAYGWPPRPGEHDPHTKVSARSYEDAEGRRFQTGAGTAVVSPQHPGGKEAQPVDLG